MPIEAILFDMDGVLVDSEPTHARLAIQLAKEEGFSLSEARVATYVGRSPLRLWEDMAKEQSLSQSPEAIAAIQVARYQALLKSDQALALMPGIRALLDRVKAAGLKLAVASSNASETVEMVIRSMHLADDFEAWAGGSEVKDPKPAPDVFLLAAKRLGVAPEACMVIEDSKNGITAAKAAGMFAVGFDNPNSGGQDLSHADRRITRFDELIPPFSRD